ncbi:MAG: hypothetical protein ACT4PU_06685 [Planctomycetota bacterium]
MNLASSLRRVLLLLVLSAIVGGCTLIDVNTRGDGHGVVSHGFISAHATAGWPADDSIFKVGLLEGRNDGAIFLLHIWRIVRVEVGLVGASVGVGPLDLGLGILFYDAYPPAYVGDSSSFDDCEECDDEQCSDEECEEEGDCAACDDAEGPHHSAHGHWVCGHHGISLSVGD